ncbi:DUF6953 family protein [Candidatus Sulfurimonas baltica]|uniref:Uncharacterized protein n=1 Tax=Candidatus Sulfurimonas baltica TaxID=2740404 RepID=A0A7S7RM68_9BACT|nr:hypothetical protein [Candidatus Sulfurimonas baltica]QOY51191.1 hypothetical protein HUE88_08605 [Candidatus Sulfurimonas baltica]
MVDTKDVAQFMFDKLEESNSLYQYDIVHDIETTYGNEFVYQNENGNMAIEKKVLTAFNKFKKENNIEWDKSEKAWFLN